MNFLRTRNLSVLIVVFAVCAAFAGVGMTPQIVYQEAFQVVGIEASTNNAKESGPDAIIGKLWQQFLGQNLLDKIPDRVDQSIIAVYTDYATDANGQYTFVLGAKVKPVPDPVLPEGMVVKPFPPDDMPSSPQTAGRSRRLSWKPGSRFGLTTNPRQTVSERIVPTSKSTTSAPPIPVMRRWIFTSA